MTSLSARIPIHNYAPLTKRLDEGSTKQVDIKRKQRLKESLIRMFGASVKISPLTVAMHCLLVRSVFDGSREKNRRFHDGSASSRFTSSMRVAKAALMSSGGKSSSSRRGPESDASVCWSHAIVRRG